MQDLKLCCQASVSFRLTVLHSVERVAGRKAKVLQREKIACKCQTFFDLSLKGQEETNLCYIFPPSLHKFKNRFFLKYCFAIMTPVST